jgi:hypothetical protein
MKALVVAAGGGENTDWVAPLHPEWAIFIDRTPDRPGRDAAAYLDWIVSYYRDLPDEIVLCQGDPFDHDCQFITHLSDPEIRWYGTKLGCSWDGNIQWKTNLHSWCDVLGLKKRSIYEFIQGAQYRLTPDQIRNRPLEFWEALLALTWVNPRAAWDYERLAPEIYNVIL